MPNKKIHKSEENQPLRYSWVYKNNQDVTEATLNRYDMTAAMFLARYCRFRWDFYWTLSLVCQTLYTSC